MKQRETGAHGNHDVYAAQCPCRAMLDLLANNGPRWPSEPWKTVRCASVSSSAACGGVSPKVLTQTLRRLEEFFLTQILLPLIADGGRIVNLSTGLTRFTHGESLVYACLKGAIETYTKYLAKELGSRDISVNAVAPGPVGTDLGGGALRDDPQLRRILAGQTALGRVGVPEDIGGVVAALLAPDTGWVTVQRIEVSGGFSL